MAQITVPDSPKEYATHYHELLGVDYQADQTEVDSRRSPDMVNMISDVGGNPVKRDGFRRVSAKLDALVMIDSVTYGVYAASGYISVGRVELDGYEFDITIVGNPYSHDVGEVRTVFTYQTKIYIVATKCLLSFDTEKNRWRVAGVGAGMMSTGAVGETAPVNSEAGVIPDTVIGLKPNGTGGTALYDKNVMSIYQRMSFRGDGSSKVFKLQTYKKMGTWVKVEVKDSDGDWTTTNDYALGTSSTVTGLTLDGTASETNHIVDAKITFTNAPADPGHDDQSDNVRITFAPYSMEDDTSLGTTVKKGYYNEQFVKLLSCQAATFQSNRMFIADKYKIYYSEVSQPFTISDLSWFEVDSEVVGFTRSNSYLVILARDTGRSTIYLAQEMSRVVDSDTGQTETYFVVKESNSGIGAIAPRCISTLSDEPIFLSRTGLYGILTNWQSEKYAVDRSSRINRRLCKEPNLEMAVGIAYNDYFYLAVNGRMYVLDGRHKESDRAGNKPLEAYFFEGLPAIEKMFVVGDRMYFMDSSNTYTWNDDLPDTERYFDNGHMSTDDVPVFTGSPVCAKWCSVYDDDGAPQRLKTLMKKGSVITLVPHFSSGCEITLVKDGDIYEHLGRFDASMQTFDYIDFTMFTFNTNPVAFDNFTKKKIKKYKRLQIQVANNNAEPFGITQITKTYTLGNYAKR